ncbi:MAG: response regulator transcription factor [Austwickia sp.]|nr:response regulator transcription factor [Austwickia sp.]MBK8436384.1 response regulator transcription factor [Austwickia sp.]MBK9102060.1 response regulator transcription factor [Austwickia sp.]
MAQVLLMTPSPEKGATVLPALGLLSHTVHVVGHDLSATMTDRPFDVVLVDARTDLAVARGLCRMLRTAQTPGPIIAVVTEGGLAAVTEQWQVTDFVLEGAGPAEVEARIRLATTICGSAERQDRQDRQEGTISEGALVIDESAYTVRVGGRALDLTYKEFELLKRLAQHPGRVATRAQLLQDVWGYDYYGGTRTVDVHVRRLRAKLGAEYESMIGTVRNVGYRFIADADAGLAAEAAVLE